MLDDGLSLIPVRDKQSGSMMPKTPFKSWQSSQTNRLKVGELWQQMETYQTEAVAIVCGKVSGNLEIIDIDSKYYEGISIILFKEIKSLRPDLYDKIRVHKTPSGGYHILYRIADGNPEGNQKLAERAKTEEEIQKDIDSGIKKPKKFVAFLETRGERGYALMPPSMGYSVHLNRPIPILSWADRCELIQICKSFNQNIVQQVTYTRTKKDNTAYDLTPWEDYNQNGGVIALLKEYGWNLHQHQTAERYYFTRPGKTKGISGSLTKVDAKFYPFTVSTELESEKTYSPCDLLVLYKFNGDKGEAFKWMVSQGYGRVKPKLEQNIAKQRAMSGGELPNNFSQAAKLSFEQLKSDLAENMPYGVFWQQDYDKPNRFDISREDLYSVADKLGFKITDGGDVVRINGSVIMAQTESQFYDTLKSYIWEEEANIYTGICNAMESFFQKSGRYTIARLRSVDKSLIMSDDRDNSYKFFQNGFLHITATAITFKDYTSITGLVWEHKVQKRKYAPISSKGVFTEYLQNAIGINDYHKKIIGYLSHDFKQESSGYIVVLVEKVPDPKDGGGSGKNIFGNMLRHTTTIKTVPGSQVKFDENFLQPWNGQRIYFLADLPKKIDWLFLKEMATGTGIHKRLYKDQVDVESEDMPKLLLNTNYSYEETDGGLMRRIRHVEFNPFYTLKGGVDVVHNKSFPVDFDSNDWADYDNFISECVQLIIKNKGKIEKVELSEDAWVKKFQMQYGETTHTFITDYIESWVESGFVSNGNFNTQYETVCTDFGIPSKFRLSSKVMSSALKDFCAKNEIKIEVSAMQRVNGNTTRGKFFGEKVEDSSEYPGF